jgi:hypothetical protein
LCKSRRSWHARKQIGLKVTLVDLVFIEGSKEDEAMEQHFVEAKIMQTDVGEENVVEVEVQPSTEVQMMAEAQQKVMKMERLESKVVTKRRRTILYRYTSG